MTASVAAPLAAGGRESQPTDLPRLSADPGAAVTCRGIQVRFFSERRTTTVMLLQR